MSALNADLSRDLAPALREWRSAIAGWRDNPIVVLSRRSAARQRTPGRLLRGLLSWGVLLIILIGVALFVVRRWFPYAVHYTVPLALVLGVLSTYMLWAGSGLYRVALDTLSLLGQPGTVRYGELRFDEAMQSSQLSERELTVGLAAVMLPRIWLRWAAAPLAGIGAWLLLLLWLSQGEGDGHVNMLARDSSYFDLAQAVARLPLTLIWLYATGLLATAILVLWLIALGRNIHQLWQAQLVAVSVTLTQLWWLLAAAQGAYRWRTMSGMTFGGPDHLAVLLLIPLLPLLAMTASLHLARRSALLRLLLAGVAPPLGLWLLVVLGRRVFGDVLAMTSPAYNAVYSTLWAFGGLGLVNIMGLPAGSLLGMEPALASTFMSFSVPRALVLLLLQVSLLALCAHAARLAVYDWRYSEA
jgi:hypothetical protein